MFIRTLIGLKLLKIAFISGIAVTYANQKCCDQNEKEKNTKNKKPIK